MDDTFRVKGSTIRTKLAFAREHLDPGVEEALSAELADAGVGRVLDGAWYDFSIYERLLKQLATLAYGGRISRLREVGMFSAELALRTTYKAFARSGDLDRFLALLPTFHTRLHDYGRLSIDAQDVGTLTVTLHGVPDDSDADIYVTEGFFTSCAQQLGCQGVRCRTERVGDVVTYRIRYSSHLKPGA